MKDFYCKRVDSRVLVGAPRSYKGAPEFENTARVFSEFFYKPGDKKPGCKIFESQGIYQVSNPEGFVQNIVILKQEGSNFELESFIDSLKEELKDRKESLEKEYEAKVQKFKEYLAEENKKLQEESQFKEAEIQADYFKKFASALRDKEDENRNLHLIIQTLSKKIGALRKAVNILSED